MVGLLGQGAMEGNDVALRQQLLHRHVANRVPVIQPPGGVFIVGKDPHAKASANIEEHPTDLSRTHDAHGLAVEVEACHSRQTEIEIPGSDVRLMDPSDGGQQHCHSMLRHGVGGVGRYTEDVDPSKGVLHVHVVKARATEGNDLDAHFA